MRTESVVDKRLFEETTLQTTLTRVREDASTKSNLKMAQLVDNLSSAKKPEPKKQQYTSDRYKTPLQKSHG